MRWNGAYSPCKMMSGTERECVRPARNRVIMLSCCAGWAQIGGTSEPPFITPNSTHAAGICKQSPKFLFQPCSQHGWRGFFCFYYCPASVKGRESGDKQVVLSEVWKRKINQLFQTVYYGMTKQLLLHQVCRYTEKSLWDRDHWCVCCRFILLVTLYGDTCLSSHVGLTLSQGSHVYTYSELVMLVGVICSWTGIQHLIKFCLAFMQIYCPWRILILL